MRRRGSTPLRYGLVNAAVTTADPAGRAKGARDFGQRDTRGDHLGRCGRKKVLDGGHVRRPRPQAPWTTDGAGEGGGSNASGSRGRRCCRR